MEENSSKRDRHSWMYYIRLSIIALLIVAGIIFFFEARKVSQTKMSVGRTDGHGHTLERKDSVIQK
jgi:hypothetical protein